MQPVISPPSPSNPYKNMQISRHSSKAVSILYASGAFIYLLLRNLLSSILLVLFNIALMTFIFIPRPNILTCHHFENTLTPLKPFLQPNNLILQTNNLIALILRTNNLILQTNNLIALIIILNPTIRRKASPPLVGLELDTWPQPSQSPRSDSRARVCQRLTIEGNGSTKLN